MTASTFRRCRAAASSWLAPLTLLALPAVAQQADSQHPAIESLQCRGNTVTSCDYILRHVRIAIGSPVDEQELSNAWFRLSALPNFDTVNIFLEKGTQRGAARVVIAVTERDTLLTEATVSGRYIDDSANIALAQRVSYQNLFGAGKIVDFVVAGAAPLDTGRKRQGVVAELQYIDPHLFDSRRNFFFGGLSYADSETRFRDSALSEDGDFATERSVALGIGVGRRVWNYSFITAAYEYRFKADSAYRFTFGDGTVESDRDTARHAFSIAYGFQSEDDPYFPTRGSRFQIGVRRAGSDADFNIGYRRTWRTGSEALWTVNFGRTPTTEYRNALLQDFGVSVGYARALQAVQSSSVARSRWYVEVGSTRLQYTLSRGVRAEVGVKAGIRLLNNSFGIIDLSLLGTTIVGSGGRDS